MRHSIITYRELGVESLGKNGFIKNIFEVFIGLTGILIGARILVNSIIGLSMAYGVSEYLIALLLMSIGTSLPELFVSVSAARKGYMTMALGNIIGSNVANILWVLGVAAIIMPISIAPQLILTQVLFMLLLSVLLIIFKRSGYVIDRREGAILLGIYVIFVIISMAFRKLGFPPEYSVYFLFLSLLGSYVNLPIKKIILHKPLMHDKGIDFHRSGYSPAYHEIGRSTSIAVNLGGAVIPVLMSIFLSTLLSMVDVVIGILVMTVIVHKISKPIIGSGIAIHVVLPPLLQLLL